MMRKMDGKEMVVGGFEIVCYFGRWKVWIVC